MYSIIQDDLEPDMGIAILDEFGVPESLIDASAFVMRWLKPDGTLTEGVTLLEDPDNGGLEEGALKRVWSSGDTSVVGVHQAQAVITRGNGEIQTYPSDGTYIKWRIYAKLEAE